MKLTAAYIPAPEGGYTAYVEEIPGAISEGETLDEARENLADALRMILECNRDIAREQQQPAGSVRETLELATV
jgi:predicted RNase H-like HicB family nuclease